MPIGNFLRSVDQDKPVQQSSDAMDLSPSSVSLYIRTVLWTILFGIGISQGVKATAYDSTPAFPKNAPEQVD